MKAPSPSSHSAKTARADQLLRRSPQVVCYWEGEIFVARNYLEGTAVAVNPLVATVLQFFGEWRSLVQLEAEYPEAVRPALARLVDHLAEQKVLLRAGGAAQERSERARTWDAWSPLAGVFHFGTRRAPVRIDMQASERRLAEKAKRHPAPPPVKQIVGRRSMKLPEPDTRGEFPRVLLERRTWRQFSRKSLRKEDLSSLLGLTWRVQKWAHAREGGRVPLKTSPSGGACHPLEVYVLVLRASGIEKGLYHYAAAEHRLELLKKGASARQVERYIPGQPRLRSPAALFLMTAVFPRSQWRYSFPRAYRSVLLEAGHFCQTFCLVATWLGLGPYTTMLLDDAAVEDDLGVDGIDECFIYAAGVGCRPPPRSG